MQPLSILMVVPNYYPYLGGLERQAHTLGKALVRRGHAVSVYTRRVERTLPAVERLDGVLVRRLPSSAATGKRADLRYPLSLALLLAHEAPRYDVIHVHSKSWFIAGCLPPALLWRRPVLLKIPNVREFGIPGDLRRRFGRQHVWLMRQAAAWAVLSPESRAELLAAGFSPERIFETRNGVDTERYAPASPHERRAARAALGLPADGPIALFAGRLTHQKGLPDLLEAWERLDALGSRPTLVACGDGPLRATLEARAQGLATVIFAGAQAEMDEYYRAADLFVLPSYAEGNSNALMEAMACGLPVVATRVGGTAELLGPYAADWLVEPGDVAGLAARLGRLLSDAGLRAELGTALAERMRTEFTIDVIASHYERCYRLLAAGQRDQLARLSQPGQLLRDSSPWRS